MRDSDLRSADHLNFGNCFTYAGELLEELHKYQQVIREGGRDVRYHVCGEVLESSDIANLQHPRWLNDKVYSTVAVQMTKSLL